jgi:proteasome lid subunit RPN8/RPN11
VTRINKIDSSLELFKACQWYQSHGGFTCMVSEFDLAGLIYLHVVVNETLRLHLGVVWDSPPLCRALHRIGLSNP